MNEQRLPPVTQMGMGSLALVVLSGIYLAAYLPQHVSLTPVIWWLSGAALVLLSALLALARSDDFPWRRFLEVARWALLAYLIVAGMIEYVFLRNHLSGGPLVALTLALILFALNVPLLIGFTVARYTMVQAPTPQATTGD